MTRLLKCYGDCGEKYSKDLLMKISNKNYCSTCYTKKQKDIKDRAILFDTIQKVYGIPYPTGQMLKQISTFRDERFYNYEGMTKAICYFVKVMQKKPGLQGGLAFVPWNYDAAIKYYDELDRRRREVTDTKTRVKVIKISNYSSGNTQQDLIKKRFIEMGDILNDG